MTESKEVMLIRRLFRSLEIKGDCMVWTKFKDNKGYGRIQLSGKKAERVHRLSYKIFVGEIPKGLVVRHTCDNSSCANPKHLLLGTHQDNVKDRNDRNRTAYGFKIKKTKLGQSDIDEIRRLWKSKEMTQVNIAKKFNITHAYAWCIANNVRRTRRLDEK